MNDKSEPRAPQQLADTQSAGSHPSTIVVQARESGGRWFHRLGWIGFLITLPMLAGLSVRYHEYFDRTGGITEKFHSGAKDGSNKIGIVRVSGAILEGDGFVKRQIDRLRDDPQVKAIVVRVDSPGGTVTGSDFIYHHLRKLREERKLPMVVSMGSLAASGGYYVAMAVGDQPQRIFAEPTTTTGSIGVIIPHYDLSGLMARYDVKDDSIVSHPRKQLLSMTHPASPEDREILQRYVDESFARFKEIVKSGRAKFRDDPAALDALATGEVFTAPAALERGLVDALGFIDDAIHRAAELAEIPVDSARVVEFEQPRTLLESMVAVRAETCPLRQILNAVATPHAYYLYSAFPPAITESW